MKRLHLLLIFFCAFLLVACSDQTPPPKEKPTPVVGSSPSSPPPLKPSAGPTPTKLKQKPNIVELLMDDMRVDDLAYMPNLRKLVAQEGIFLANGFSSYPLCCPARASFFSGMLPHNHHVYTVSKPYGYRAFDDRKTLATSLQAAGYSTAFFGKYLNGYGSDKPLAPKLNGRANNFESQYYVPDGWDEWRGSIQGTWCKPACGGTYHYFKYGWSENGVPTAVKTPTFSSTVITTQAVEVAKKFMKKRKSEGNPFFLSLNYTAPHNGGGDGMDSFKLKAANHPCFPGGPAAPAWAYEAPEVKAITRGAGILADGTTEANMKDKPGKFSEKEVLSKCQQEGVKLATITRAASLYATDAKLPLLINYLKKHNQWDNTVFLFWSDNGYFLGEHRIPSGKRLAYEPSIRVPMLITGPGMRGGDHKGIYGGQDRYSPVNVTNLTATLLDFAEAKPPHEGDGMSVKPMLLKGDRPWSNTMMIEAVNSNPALKGDKRRDKDFAKVREAIADPRSSIGFRTARYTYVRYVNTEWELYDNWKDPNQWHNLAKNARWLKTHASLVQKLESHWLQVKDCKGSGCELPLPKELQVEVPQLKKTTRQWFATMDKLYAQ